MPSTLNHQLITQSFSKSIATYHQHAIVQKKMAKRLIELLVHQTNSNIANHVLELGCGTGLLTQELCKKLSIKELITNDINIQFKSLIIDYIRSQSVSHQFISGDAAQISLKKKMDVITANALLQWIEDKQYFFAHLKSLSHKNTLLAFSCFSDSHFKEIKLLTGIGLNYPKKEEIQQVALPYFKLQTYHQDKHILYFDSPLAVLKHIKNTGVNAIQKTHWCKKNLQQFSSNYNQFKTTKGYPLSYYPNYFIFKRQ